MSAIDEQMANILAEKVDLLNNIPFCKKLCELKRDFEEAEQR